MSFCILTHLTINVKDAPLALSGDILYRLCAGAVQIFAELRMFDECVLYGTSGTELSLLQ